MRFGVNFEIILNRNGYFHAEIHINYSCMYMMGGSGAYASSPELKKKWCSLVRFGIYFDQILS